MGRKGLMGNNNNNNNLLGDNNNNSTNNSHTEPQWGPLPGVHVEERVVGTGRGPGGTMSVSSTFRQFR